jgi:hypothetical protein
MTDEHLKNCIAYFTAYDTSVFEWELATRKNK